MLNGGMPKIAGRRGEDELNMSSLRTKINKILEDLLHQCRSAPIIENLSSYILFLIQRMYVVSICAGFLQLKKLKFLDLGVERCRVKEKE